MARCRHPDVRRMPAARAHGHGKPQRRHVRVAHAVRSRRTRRETVFETTTCRDRTMAPRRPGARRTARGAGAARIDLLPHQLEPAVAILRGDGCRVLLADDVGLGKTIQACVAAAELKARAAADRILILTPPGLRDQWKTELSERFRLQAET